MVADSDVVVNNSALVTMFFCCICMPGGHVLGVVKPDRYGNIPIKRGINGIKRSKSTMIMNLVRVKCQSHRQ